MGTASKKKGDARRLARLRQRAEAWRAQSPAAVSQMPPRDVEKLVHELRVYQAELEMQNEELRRVELQLEDARDLSHNRFAQLYDLAPVGHLTLDHDGVVREANLTAAGLLGRDRQEVVKKKLSRFIAPASQDEWYLHLQQVFTTAAKQTCDLHMRRPDGTTFTGRLASVAVAAQPERPAQCLVALSEVTRQHQPEAALRRQQDLLESVMRATDVMLVLLDRQFNFVWVNEAYAATCRKTPAEMVGKNHFALYPDKENEATFRKVRDTGQAVFFKDKPFSFSDQPERGVTYWDWSLSPVKNERGDVTDLVFSLRETTPFKQAADALARSRAERVAIFEAMTDAVVFADAERRIVMVNPAFASTFGYSADEARGRTTDFLYASSHAYREQGRHRYRRRGSVKTGPYEIQYRRKDGSVFWAESSGSPVRDSLGETVGFVSVHRDITARKQAEEAVQREKESYRTLAENLPGLVYRVHLGDHRRMEFFNQLLVALTGYTEAELKMGEACSIEPLIVAEDRAAVVAAVQRAIRTHQPFEVEYRLRTKAGELRHFSERGQPVYAAGETCVHLDGVIFDVTARKEAAAGLQESRARLSQLTENIREVFWLGSPDWNEVLYISPGYEDLWGRPCESLYRSPRSWMDAIVAEDRPAVRAAMEEGIAGKLPAPFPVYRVKRPDGTIRWVQARAWPVRDEAGRVYRIAGIVEDITERKRTEAALRESEGRYRELVQNANSAIIRWARDGKITFFNEYAQSLFGYRAKEVLRRHVGILVPKVESTGGDLRPLVRDIVAHPERHTQKINENVCRDGRRVWMAWTNKPLLDERGRLKEILAVGMDITERKRAETLLQQLNATLEQRVSERTEELTRANELLRASEQALADFFAEAPLGLLWVAPDGRILRANHALAAMLGCRVEELFGRQLAEFCENPEVALAMVLRLVQKESLHDNLLRLQGKNRSMLDVLVDANGLWENGKLVRSRWFVRDVTRRVELQKEILAIGECVQQRIGQDLHDDLCQRLTSIEYLARALDRQLDCNTQVQTACPRLPRARLPGTCNLSPCPHSPRAQEITRLLRQTITYTRELAHTMTPVELESEGLSGALGNLAARTKKHFDIVCRFRCDAPVVINDSVAQTYLYRIAQEAINNAIKHGKAKRIHIGLKTKGDKAILTVQDNGVGLPLKPRKRKGSGLRIMDYRAAALGGSLVVRNRESGGTTVVCSIPNALTKTAIRCNP